VPQAVIIFLRSTFAFVTLLALTRLIGKKQVSQLTFFDYVNGITIGSIAAGISIDLSVETIPSWVGLSTWTFWVVLLGVIDLKSRKWGRFIDGEPTVVIQNGKILESKLEQLNYNIDDLRTQLRMQGVFSIAEVEFAILESNGELSVLKKSQHLPLTPADMGISTNYKGIAVELIMDGKIIDDNLVQLRLSREWLLKQLAAREHKLEEVFYAELDTSGSLYIDLWDDLDELPQVLDVSDQ
jgi:uncharacterized membrane protein YcaP (DUF421 family)